jgi:4-amino-4-deoxy-L-arabinose transferase-like glycosyltransferase
MPELLQERVSAQHARTLANAPLWRECAVLAGFCAFLLFFGLARFGLIGADEPRYAQIAREMLERHDWVVPVLYGKPWLEKPILYYWQAMLSYSVFGVSDWAARLPVAIDAAAMVFAAYFFARRFLRGVQLDAALILASMAAVIGFGRAASTDMPLAATFTIGMLGWLAWHETGAAKWLAAFYVSMGFATLAKGPIAPFLAALIIVVFSIIRRDLHVILRTLQVPGIMLYLAVALPWYVAVQMRVPEFFRTFIVEHNFARYGSDVFRHHQPFWYYGPVLLLALLPWTVLVVTALVHALPRLRRGDTVRSAHDADRKLALLLWAVLPILFFSFSGSKLPGYILPSVPAWALVVAEWLYSKLSKNERLNPILLVAHAAVGGLLVAAALLSQFLVYKLRPTAHAYEIAATVAGVVFIGLSILLIMRGVRVLRLATLVPVVIGLAFVVKVGAPAIDSIESARPLEQEIRRLGRGGAPVTGMNIRRETEYGLAYYLNRPIALYDRNEAPPPDHLLVVDKSRGNGKAVMVPGAHAYWIGNYAPQHIEFYWVENSPPRNP